MKKRLFQLFLLSFIKLSNTARSYKHCNSDIECSFGSKCTKKYIKKRDGQGQWLSRCTCDHIKCHEYPQALICVEKRTVGLSDLYDPFHVLENYCEVTKLQCLLQSQIKVQIVEEACERVIYSLEEMDHYISSKTKKLSKNSSKTKKSGQILCNNKNCGNNGVCLKDLTTNQQRCSCDIRHKGEACSDILPASMIKGCDLVTLPGNLKNFDITNGTIDVKYNSRASVALFVVIALTIWITIMFTVALYKFNIRGRRRDRSGNSPVRSKTSFTKNFSYNQNLKVESYLGSTDDLLAKEKELDSHQKNVHVDHRVKLDDNRRNERTHDISHDGNIKSNSRHSVSEYSNLQENLALAEKPRFPHNSINLQHSVRERADQAGLTLARDMSPMPDDNLSLKRLSLAETFPDGLKTRHASTGLTHGNLVLPVGPTYRGFGSGLSTLQSFGGSSLEYHGSLNRKGNLYSLNYHEPSSFLRERSRTDEKILDPPVLPPKMSSSFNLGNSNSQDSTSVFSDNYYNTGNSFGVGSRRRSRVSNTSIYGKFRDKTVNHLSEANSQENDFKNAPEPGKEYPNLNLEDRPTSTLGPLLSTAKEINKAAKAQQSAYTLHRDNISECDSPVVPSKNPKRIRNLTSPEIKSGESILKNRQVEPGSINGKLEKFRSVPRNIGSSTQSSSAYPHLGKFGSLNPYGYMVYRKLF